MHRKSFFFSKTNTHISWNPGQNLRLKCSTWEKFGGQNHQMSGDTLYHADDAFMKRICIKTIKLLMCEACGMWLKMESLE